MRRRTLASWVVLALLLIAVSYVVYPFLSDAGKKIGVQSRAKETVTFTLSDECRALLNRFKAEEPGTMRVVYEEVQQTKIPQLWLTGCDVGPEDAVRTCVRDAERRDCLQEIWQQTGMATQEMMSVERF